MSIADYLMLFAGVFALAIFVILYFLPSLIAIKRQNRNATAICVLNLLTGWMFFGWVAALVWALFKD